MKTDVVRFHETGGPSVLRIDEIPLVEPREGEVRIRVEAMALNRADTLWRAGIYIETPILPSRIGYDIAGMVEAVGPSVTELKLGDRVSSFPAASVQRYGNHGETAVYPADALLKYPDKLSPREAVAVNNGLFTAYFPLIEIARLTEGQVVVITAGSSSTGMAALQIAKRVRATTIATTRTSKKVEELLAADFDHVLVTESDDVTAQILEHTQGEGADVIYDAVAGPGVEALANATKRLGHMIIYGVLGAMDAPTPLPLWPLFIRTIRLHAAYKVFDFCGNENMGIPPNQPAVVRAKKFILRGLEQGEFTACIDKTFHGLGQYVDAHWYMESNAQSGKIVITL